ncbi:hypothetical protein GS501_00010 [Saccharibacter sp. 17.LH.SD]|uniref:hypothetical protein n=1 Tax=Saccharibacter sp. 17.LH.SD TaxID=2689393 RepID=UPI00136D9C50|nr:hypothetical protein [Saccharibacter sp. 17.LH.SD]MXV43464.1 hypothetical protein [Saccharibacter sp. 17.LH.SD]
MPSLSELAGSNTPLANALEAGLKDISYDQSVPFRKYKRVVLPLDGFIFWVACSAQQDVKGSLHARTESTQNEWASYDQSGIVFTTKKELDPFHEETTELDTVWVGTWQGIKFAIGARSQRYEQAGLQHYLGDTIPPTFCRQFIETEAELEGISPIVSNSLPFFLAMATESPAPLAWCAWPRGVPVFPSFSVPDNQNAPYVSAHHESESTTALSMGTRSPNGTTDTLTRERVRLRLVGLTNEEASNVLNFVTHWALLNWDKLGVLNTPILRDDKRPLAPINTLGMLKTIDFDVMYSQHAARSVAFQTIQSAKLTLQSAVKNPKLQTISHAHVALRTSL